jgi:hypothetical protein
VHIVDGGQPVSQELSTLEQMAKVSTREMLASVADTSGLNRTWIPLKHSISDVQAPIMREQSPISRQPRGQNAVKQVDTA